MANDKDLLILGDYTTDIFLYAEKWREKSLYIREAPRKDYPFTLIRVPGGAGALTAYLQACSHGVRLPKEEEKKAKKESDKNSHKEYLESLYLLTRIEEETGPVWRVDKDRGSLPWGDAREHKGSTCLETEELKDAQCVIVMDFDGGWRGNKPLGGEANWEKLAAGIRDKPYLIRSHDPLKCEWQQFRAQAKKHGARPGIWVGVAEDLADGALRRAGIWDDYRDRIVEYLQGDETLWKKGLGWQHVVVIRIDYDGALVLAPGSREKGDLLIFPGDQPGSFLRTHPGHVVGGGIAFVASFVQALNLPTVPDPKAKDKKIIDFDKWRELLHACAKQGLARSREVMEKGYLDPEDGKDRRKLTEARSGYQSLLNVVGHVDDRSVVPWSPPVGDWETVQKVVCGNDSEFRYSTVLNIGGLVSANMKFASALLNLERRLKQHADTGEKVLSFAIFGEPGSGKSFVAKSLQKAIDPNGQKFETISYNLSQFGGSRERLVAAFKAISRISLQEKTPFVLWDEFDCALNQQKCGWLQEFLMPMEEAEFNDGNENRQLGRCVFVFMGGIHEDETSFLEWMEGWQTYEEAKLLKAPDFHSRLEGTLELPSVVLTREGRTSIHKADEHKLNRAILIRRFLGEARCQNIKRIAPGVLAYLLHVTFRHGVRSLKKIIEGSALDKTTIFGVLHLPPKEVLESHVKEPDVGEVLGYLRGVEDEPLELLWRRYGPKGVERYANTLGKVENSLGRCLAKKTYKKFKEVETEPFLTDYDDLSRSEKDRWEESARTAIRNKRYPKTDKPSDD
ncbi:MAG: hypothetical protein HY914_17130 [Desulfomonile tiedjei]|nr:hypothetical protein [Desulfomonile tiedjei]